ncbi:MAG: calcineurin-like phosphoesterase C-terminal domain-containing protein [Bacteroidales bacterium]|nr:calcineurin-like phosphoesterase C-terminal domain-containing protein [Bacteroidales bacterium]
MKARLTFLSMLIILSGCTVESVHLDLVLAGTVEGVRIELEQPTKTDVEYDASENVIHSSWAEGDAVMMSDLVSTAAFTLADGEAGKTRAVFNGSLGVAEGQPTVYGVYPYGNASLSGSSLRVSLPSEQNASNTALCDLKAVSVPSSVILSGSPALSMKNLTAIFRVSLTLPDTIDGLSLTGETLKSFSLTAQKGISGSCAISWDGTDPSLSSPGASTITYTFPENTSAVGKSTFLLFLCPVEFTQGENVVWAVETDRYRIRLRLSPGMSLEKGTFYKAGFNLAGSAWTSDASLDGDRDYTVDIISPDPVILSTDSTPSTVSFYWSEPASQTNHRYLIELSDASRQVLRSYVFTIGTSGHRPAFTFAGLSPATNYNVRVKGYKNGAETEYSDYKTIRTADALSATEQTLLLTDFDLCPWGGDYLHVAAAVKPSGTSAVASLSAGWGRCPDTDEGYTTLGQSSGTAFSALAGTLGSTYASMLSEIGLDGWTFSNVYMRPGYVQVGSSSSASLTTPAIGGLSSGSHTIDVAFKAVPFTASGSKSGSVTVTCTSSGGTVIGTQTVNLPATATIPSELPVWTECEVSFSSVTPGSKVQFSNGGTSNDFCIDEIHISSDDALPPIPHDAGNNVYGLVSDTSGNPISGVVVSDGYVVTQTGSNGVYQFNSAKANGYVFISQPQGYEVALDGVFPQFWQALSSNTSEEERHDFKLTPVNNSDCVILALGDMHLCNRNALYDLRQFRKETEELYATVQSLQAQGKKVYGLTLGDMTWDIYWDNSSGLNYCNFDLAAYRSEINNDFTGIDFPIWQTIGNHDHDYRETGDWDTVIPYKQILGPTYYSFNVAGYHIISLDNVICSNDGTSGGRASTDGITSDIQSWLQKDIAKVPSSMPVIVSMHEQAYKPTNPTGSYSMGSSASVLTSVLGSRNIHIVTGHTHNINNVSVSGSVYEHNAGALCASWWWTGRYSITSEASWGGGTSLSDTYHIGRDGAPGGYTIYSLSNGSMTWKYKAFGLPETRQFKTYDRNQFTLTAANWCPNASSSHKTAFETLAAKQPDYSYAKAPGERVDGLFSAKVPENMVYINVWNWDPDWSISVREGSTNLTVTPVTGAYDPMHMVAYPATRYNSGNGTTSTFVTCPTQHIFRVTASSASSTLTITVTDRFGNTYTETMTRPKTFDVNWD